MKRMTAADATPELLPIEGGRFVMGTDRGYPEEAPAHERVVAPFRMAKAPVLVGQFRRFVADTGWVTVAERAVDERAFGRGGAEPAGSAVFAVPPPRSAPSDPLTWWSFVRGADWRHPWGPDSTIEGCEDHPVTHIAGVDAAAYADWAGLRLPSEAEWEFAALAGTVHHPLGPDGPLPVANIWRGEFPHHRESGIAVGTTAVGSYPPNAFGLYDMIGNVWEWTSDRFAAHRSVGSGNPCCGPATAHTGDSGSAPMVAKGGSFLCAPNYCARYRPAARLAQAADSTAMHLGFRCVADM